MIWAVENQSTRSKICPSATLSVTKWWCECYHAFNPCNRYVLWLQSLNMHQALESIAVCVCMWLLCCAQWIMDNDIATQHPSQQSRHCMSYCQYVFCCQTQQTFIKFISDCYIFWFYRLSSGNIIHNSEHVHGNVRNLQNLTHIYPPPHPKLTQHTYFK